VKSLRAVQTSLTSPETFKMGLATLVKAVVNGHPGKNFIINSIHGKFFNFYQTSITNQCMPIDNALSPTQCVRSHLGHQACLPMLEQIQTTLPVCTEIEVTHGTIQVSSHQVPTTT